MNTKLFRVYVETNGKRVQESLTGPLEMELHTFSENIADEVSQRAKRGTGSRSRTVYKVPVVGKTMREDWKNAKEVK